jgi:steroid 5-alpha reductase family enzyme
MSKTTNLRLKLRNLSKSVALGLVLAIYLSALAIAWSITRSLKNSTIHPLFIVLIADIGATIFVFLASQVLKNASTYDPYWSVTPIFILTYFWQFNPEFPSLSLRQIIVVVLVMLWIIRLTGNWIGTWRGWEHEDWRYAKFRQDNPKIFWLINLTGIQMFPTIIVFLGCLSLWPIFTLPSAPASTLNWIDIVGVIVTLGAIALEFFADIQVHRFTNNPQNQGKTITTGLWRISRHPNYLGEISFWWGLYFFALAANPSFWWTIVGPIMMVVLFLGISIPMMEKRNLERRSDYQTYRQCVPKLIPIPIRKFTSKTQ